MNDPADALNEWLEACGPYCEPRDGTDAEAIELIRTAKALVEFLRSSTAYEHADHHNAWMIGDNVLHLSMQFLTGQYTDSDTDAPCDIEWDVYSFLERAIEGYKRPADHYPAYVLSTIYPTPEV